jgi:2-amino-4-hydroxy-6-hydroxymethyldihydropteridine diphosphokinase
MIRVYVGIGSNLYPERRILQALSALQADYRHLDISPIYASRAIGGYSGEFLNLVVGFDTSQSITILTRRLRDIEFRCGRLRDGVPRRRLSMDLDLLLFGDWCGEVAGHRLPRPDLTEQAFVLAPLADIAGDRCHPLTGENYQTLWARFPHRLQPLRRVEWQSPCEHVLNESVDAFAMSDAQVVQETVHTVGV